MPKTMIKQWIDAGPLHLETLRPKGKRGDTPQARGAKRKMSSEVQQKMNDKRSCTKLELDLASNYLPGDLVLTLTYDNEHLPFSRMQCAAALKYFRAKLSASRAEQGKELVMHWNTERKHGDTRWHHHVVMNNTGEDYRDIVALWGRGDIWFQRLKLDQDHSYAALARYMTKERPDKLGQRTWSYTRNAKHPKIETALVEADTTLNAPKGSQILEKDSYHSQFGRTEFIKYLDLDLQRRKTGRRKKKKK